MSAMDPGIDPDIVFEGTEEQMVEVNGLKKYYPIREGILNRQVGEVRAVDGISFSIPRGQTLGLVGESGCGKTTAGKAMLRIVEPTAGTVRIDGQAITELSGSDLKAFRRRMQMVYQDPTSSLNPRKQVKDIITEPMRIHDVGSRADRRDRVEELLELVGLPPADFKNRYPSSLSGGQKQRVGIARAVALNPDFIVLDEPTSALDVSVQARVVDILEELQDRLGLTYMFISHDLSLVKNVADWICIMYLGKIVEIGDTEAIFQRPQHPYTRVLLSAISTITPEDEALKPEEAIVDGETPDPRNGIDGCVFRGRCPEEFDRCAKQEPPLYEIERNHYARCFLHDEPVTHGRPEWVMAGTSD